MASKATKSLPIGPLRDLLAWWRKSKVRGLIIGGLAVALVNRSRTTLDVDAMVCVAQEQWSSFLKAGERFSFRSRIPDPLVFAETNRMLLLHHRMSKTDVDISLGAMPFELEALERAKFVKVGRLSVPTASVEDLIVLKAVANRPIDHVDIAWLLETPDLDHDQIRRHVDEFAQVLEAPEIYTNLDAMIRESQKTRCRKAK